MSDQDKISPYNINTISTRLEMRIKKNINLGIISWSNTKFSELTLWLTVRRITNLIWELKGQGTDNVQGQILKRHSSQMKAIVLIIFRYLLSLLSKTNVYSEKIYEQTPLSLLLSVTTIKQSPNFLTL